MSLQYNGEGKYKSVSLLAVTKPPLRRRRDSTPFSVKYLLRIGGLTITISPEDAVKLWDDLGSKIEKVSDPNFFENFLKEMKENGVDIY